MHGEAATSGDLMTNAKIRGKRSRRKNLRAMNTG